MEASRIANVTAVIAPMAAVTGSVRAQARDDARRLAGLCRALFEEVVWLGGEAEAPPGCRLVRPEPGAPADRAGLGAAAVAAQGERLLWIGVGDGPEPALRADALLALVAWPEHAVVQPVDAAGRALPFAIYRRADLLADLRAASGQGEDRAPACDARPGERVPERITLAALGLEGAPAPIFAWCDGAE
jgi:hypothetical protein